MDKELFYKKRLKHRVEHAFEPTSCVRELYILRFFCFFAALLLRGIFLDLPNSVRVPRIELNKIFDGLCFEKIAYHILDYYKQSVAAAWVYIQFFGSSIYGRGFYVFLCIECDILRLDNQSNNIFVSGEGFVQQKFFHIWRKRAYFFASSVAQPIRKTFSVPRMRVINWCVSKIDAGQFSLQSSFQATNTKKSFVHFRFLPNAFVNHVSFPTVFMLATAFPTARRGINLAIYTNSTHFISLASSIIRRTTSATLSPSRLASWASHLSWGSVKAMERRVFMFHSNSTPLGVCQGAL